MTPLKQRNRHDPANGVYGDCHRAAIASMLDLPLDAVPHFYEGGCDGEAADKAEREFLVSQSIVPIVCLYQGADLGTLLAFMGTMNPGVYYLLGGESRNGVGHTVVCRGAEIAHDPSLDDSGIVGPMKDGYFWVTFFGCSRFKE